MWGEPTHSGEAAARQVARMRGSMLPIPHVGWPAAPAGTGRGVPVAGGVPAALPPLPPGDAGPQARSEEHTSELQSRRDLVCRLLLEKKKNIIRKLTNPEQEKKISK